MRAKTPTAWISRGALVALALMTSLMLNACSAASPDSSAELEQMQTTGGGLQRGDGVSQNHGGYSRDSIAGAPAIPEEDAAAGMDASTIPAEERYVIRTVGLRLQVSDVDKAVRGVREEVASAKGMITALQISTEESIPVYRYEEMGALGDGAPLAAYITARVPADSLDSFISTVSKLGTVQRQAEDESDVTQEHIDLSARLETFKAQEKRLREFFEQAKKVEEMLAIEQELTRVRSEIESLTAQIAYLERQAAMATVTVELATRPAVVSPGGADWGFLDAVTTGVRGLVRTINGLIVFVLTALPILVLLGGIALLARWVIRRRGRRRPSDAAARSSVAGDSTEEIS